MSGVRNIGNFQFYEVNRLVKGELRVEHLPVSQRIDEIKSTHEYNRVLLALGGDHETKESIKNHIVLYSAAGIIVPVARRLTILPEYTPNQKVIIQPFTIFTTSVAYGRIRDANDEVLEDLRVRNLENLARAAYDDVQPDGWCSILIGNDVVEIR